MQIGSLISMSYR